MNSVPCRCNLSLQTWVVGSPIHTLRQPDRYTGEWLEHSPCLFLEYSCWGDNQQPVPRRWDSFRRTHRSSADYPLLCSRRDSSYRWLLSIWGKTAMFVGLVSVSIFGLVALVGSVISLPCIGASDAPLWRITISFGTTGMRIAPIRLLIGTVPRFGIHCYRP